MMAPADPSETIWGLLCSLEVVEMATPSAVHWTAPLEFTLWA